MTTTEQMRGLAAIDSPTIANCQMPILANCLPNESHMEPHATAWPSLSPSPRLLKKEKSPCYVIRSIRYHCNRQRLGAAITEPFPTRGRFLVSPVGRFHSLRLDAKGVLSIELFRGVDYRQFAAQSGVADSQGRPSCRNSHEGGTPSTIAYARATIYSVASFAYAVFGRYFLQSDDMGSARWTKRIDR